MPMPGMDEVKYVLGVTSGKGTDAVSLFVFDFFLIFGEPEYTAGVHR